MRRWLYLLAGAALLAACGKDENANSHVAHPPTTPAEATQTAAAADGVTTVAVTLTEYAVQVDTKQLPAGPVRLLVRNAGQRGHELQVYPLDALAHGGHTSTMAAGSAVPAAVGRLPLVPVGETRALDVVLAPGSWELGCHLADSENGRPFDHYDRGMKLAVAVGV